MPIPRIPGTSAAVNTRVTPGMDIVYGSPALEMDDVLTQAPGMPTADQILDKYIQAVGGAQRLAGLSSFVGKGTSLGFGGFGGRTPAVTRQLSPAAPPVGRFQAPPHVPVGDGLGHLVAVATQPPGDLLVV